MVPCRRYGHPGAPEEEFYYFTDDGNTEYVSWLGYSEPAEVRLVVARSCASRFVEGEDSVVAKWLKPPFGADGWRIDVANMTGRLGAVDLNAEVRQLLRETMIGINPDTILLGESTNDAASDLQGDGWHGAMTYPSFTRPVWGWLSEPTGAAYLDANGVEQTEAWFFGQPIGGIPRYTAREFVDAVVRFTAGIPWRVRLGNMQPLDTHDTARFATNAAPGTIPVARRALDDAARTARRLRGRRVRPDRRRRRARAARRSRGSSESEPDVAERLALYRDLVGLRRAHAVLATGGLRWVHVDDESVVFVRESAEESVLVLARAATSTSSSTPEPCRAPRRGRACTGMRRSRSPTTVRCCSRRRARPARCRRDAPPGPLRDIVDGDARPSARTATRGSPQADGTGSRHPPH